MTNVKAAAVPNSTTNVNRMELNLTSVYTCIERRLSEFEVKFRRINLSRRFNHIELSMIDKVTEAETVIMLYGSVEHYPKIYTTVSCFNMGALHQRITLYITPDETGVSKLIELLV